MLTAGAYGKATLLAVTKHMRAATGSLSAAAVRGRNVLKIQKKMASTKRLETQFRFKSLRPRGRPVKAGLRKPSATQAAAARYLLLAKLRNNQASRSASAAAEAFDGMECGDIPYCLDTEDV